MSKITKSDLLNLIQEQADMLVELTKLVELNKRAIIKLENESENPQPKQLDQAVFNGLDEKWRFAAVDDDGRAYAFMRKPEIDETDPCFIDGDATRCKWAGEGYDTSNWQNSLIKRDSKELTGSELCKAMLKRGDKCVLIRMGTKSDKQAKEIGRFAIAISVDKLGCFNVISDQQPISKVDFAVPINNQGEPLTARDVGI